MPISSLTGQYFGSLPGGPTQAGKGAYGAVPTVPSPTGTQTAAIQGNLANLGQLTGLTNQLNTTIAQQAALPYQLNLPQYQGMLGQSSKNILSQLQGQVPQDVANQLQQMAAERGVSTGAIGSPNANAALLRSLGLTSLGLQQQGEQNLTGAIGRTPTGQQFNPQTFLTTPSQMQEAAYMANLYSAAPNPAAAANAAKRAGQEGLNTSIGGLAQPRGGVTMPGADFFGNVYNPGSEYGGTLFAPSLGTQTYQGGVLGGTGGSIGWPGGAQGGQAVSPTGSDQWLNNFYSQFDIGQDVGNMPSIGSEGNFSGYPQTGEQIPGYTGSTWEDMFPTGSDMFSDEGG